MDITRLKPNIIAHSRFAFLTQSHLPVPPPPRNSCGGFTLIELLTVIAIIGILAGILIPVIGRVRDSARSALCVSNLRQLQNGAMLWMTANRERMPDARFWSYNEGPTNPAYPYQLGFYLNITTQKNIPSDAIRNVMRCEAAYSTTPSLSIYGRTYAINSFATATFEGVPRAVANGYPARLTQIPATSRMAFFMDGAPDSLGNYLSNVSNSHVPAAANPVLANPHRGATNVAYIDGHVERIDETRFRTNFATDQTSFWRFDR